MRQDDYYLKQIDILGKILGKIVSDILKLKSKGDILDIFEETQRSLKKEIDIDLNDLINKSNDDLLIYLTNEKKFDINHLEKLAEIFLELSYNKENLNSQNLIQKSLMIYNFVNDKDTTYSIERIKKIEKINVILKN